MGIESYFQQDCVVKRKTTPDGSWGSEEAFQQLGSCKGWIQPGSGKVQYQDGKLVSQSTHLLLCAAGTDIKAQDRVICNGVTYKVIHPQDAAGLSHHLEVELERID